MSLVKKVFFLNKWAARPSWHARAIATSPLANRAPSVALPPRLRLERLQIPSPRSATPSCRRIPSNHLEKLMSGIG